MPITYNSASYRHYRQPPKNVPPKGGCYRQDTATSTAKEKLVTSYVLYTYSLCRQYIGVKIDNLVALV